MAKVVLMVGEGPSDRNFFISLLKNKYGYSAIEHNKYQYVFNRDDIYWVIPFPPDVSKRSGYSRLTSIDTYKGLAGLVGSHKHMFSPDSEVHYLLLRDGDCCDKETRESLITEIHEIAGPILKKNYIVHMPQGELENWFLAGLDENFPHFSLKPLEIKKVIENEVESMVDAKEKFKSMLIEEMVAETSLIAAEVGVHFDVKKACKCSPTFNSMIIELNKLGLI